MPLNRAVLQNRSRFYQLSVAAVAAGGIHLITTAPVVGQTDEGAPNAADLKAVEQDLERERTAQEEAFRQAAKVADDAAVIRRNMVDAARRIQERERVLTQLEDQLENLEAHRDALAKTLKHKDQQMRQVLLALERLAVRPTDALMLQPLRPADAVRSGLVLSAAVPALTENAVRLRVDLESLYRTRTEIIDRRANVAANAAALLDEQAGLERLYAEKAELQEGFKLQAEAATKRMDGLAKEADGLRDLLERIVADRLRQAAEEAEQTAKAPFTLTPPDGAAPTPDVVIARRPPPPAEVRSFALARGTLPFPATGRLAQRYGEQTKNGVRSKGIIIATRPDAQVVSPFDAIVAYSGPFRGYGQLLILEHSEGYHTLMAGMSRLEGVVGQRVLAGEPVGVMAPEGATSLYVELRRDGQPMNPLPWLAAQNNEIRG
jgi:septal ring factor EnvC (AmiA/AmiB activator)